MPPSAVRVVSRLQDQDDVAGPWSAGDAPIWNPATSRFEAAIPTSAPLSASLAADAPQIVSPQPVAFHSGSFTADAATVLLTIDVGAGYQEGIASHGNLLFAYGVHGTSPLTPTTQGVSGPQAPAGVTLVQAGTVSAPQSNSHTAVLLTGLAIGQRYDWELSATVTGFLGSTTWPLGGSENPSMLRCSGQSQLPEAMALDYVIAVAGAAYIHVIHSNHSGWRGGPVDEFVGYVALPAGRTGGECDITSDGKTIVVVNYTPKTVQVIDVASLSITATYTMPAASTGPLKLRIDPTNTYAWILDFNSGYITRMTIATGAFTTAFQVAAGVQYNSVDITPNGSFLLIGGNNGTLYVVSTAGNAGAGSLSGTLANAAAPCNGLAADPNDSTKLYAVFGHQIGIISIAAPAAPAWSNSIVQSGWTPNSLVCLPDSKSIIVGSSTGAAAHNVFEYGLPGLVEYTEWSNPTSGTGASTPVLGLAVTPNGSMLAGAANSAVNDWFGGRFSCRPVTSGVFGQEKASVMLTPAH